MEISQSARNLGSLCQVLSFHFTQKKSIEITIKNFFFIKGHRIYVSFAKIRDPPGMSE